MTSRRIQIRPVGSLHPHEEIKLKKADKLIHHMRRTRMLPKPILIDAESGVILDGHHRFAVCKELGCREIACVAIDYLHDDSIQVTARHPGERVTKEEVIAKGLSDKVFPPKTTKHLYDYKEMERSFPLRMLGALPPPKTGRSPSGRRRRRGRMRRPRSKPTS